jgi:hypothetical protein
LVRCTCAEHCALHHGQRSCVSSGSRSLGLPGIHPYWWRSSHLPLALRLRIFTVRFVEVKKNIHSNFLPLNSSAQYLKVTFDSFETNLICLFIHFSISGYHLRQIGASKHWFWRRRKKYVGGNYAKFCQISLKKDHIFALIR